MEIYAYIYTHDCNFTWGGGGGGVGDYSKQLIAAEKCIVETEKLIERLEKKN